MPVDIPNKCSYYYYITLVQYNGKFGKDGDGIHIAPTEGTVDPLLNLPASVAEKGGLINRYISNVLFTITEIHK